MKYVLLLPALILMYSQCAWAQFPPDSPAPLSPGNLVVSKFGRITELTPDGEFVQEFDVPLPDSIFASRLDVRDITVDEAGSLHVFNGTFNPLLSTLDFSTRQWSDQSYDGWGTFNVSSFGGIASFGDTVFVSSTGRTLTGLAFGGNEVVEFGIGRGSRKLSLGLDGFLYLLEGLTNSSATARYVDVYNPANLSFVRRIDLWEIITPTSGGLPSVVAIAVDGESNLYVAEDTGRLRKISPSGDIVQNRQLQTVLNERLLNDLDLDGFGNLLVTTRSGQAYLTNENFATGKVFPVEIPGGTTLRAFGAFVQTAQRPELSAGDFFGTPNDDLVEIDLENRVVTINGRSTIVGEDVEVIRFFSDEGHDVLFCKDVPDVADMCVVDGEKFNVYSAGIELNVCDCEFAEFQGSDSQDTGLILDTPGDDSVVYRRLGATIQTSGGNEFTILNTGTVRAESAGGSDQAVFYGTSQQDILLCSLQQKLVRISGNRSITFDGFERFIADARELDHDAVVIYDSEGDDRFLSKDDLLVARGDHYKYSFREFESQIVSSFGAGRDTVVIADGQELGQFLNLPWLSLFRVPDEFTKYFLGFDEVRHLED